MTAKNLLDLVRDLAGSYGVEIKLSDRIIYRSIQYSVDEVYRRIVAKRPEWFEKTTTLNDAAALPSDYVSFVDAYIDGSPRLGIRFATIPEKPSMSKNTAAQADATEPVFLLWDHEWNMLPTGTNGSTLVYNGKPTQFYHPGGTIDWADTAIIMPDDTFGLIVRGAFERLTVLMTADEGAALEITQSELERVQKANTDMYMENLERLLQNSRGGIDVSVR